MHARCTRKVNLKLDATLDIGLAVQRALAELDFAPGELDDDQYEVTIIIPPEEGFMALHE